ncbi:MAG: RNA polymerase sporulation sigma factor SigH [Actinomycetota bacterium]|nr:RNA polymerase sporulation sigma factor SigH [Actinomycetota bacterium]
MSRPYDDVLEPYERDLAHASARSPGGRAGGRSVRNRWEPIGSDANDEALVDRYREGDAQAMEVLLARYRSFARAKVKTYFMRGADKDDIVQEGMIGLYKAIRDFSADKESSFRAFAELCITRQIITAVKSATRHKHTPLNSYVSLTKPIGTADDPERMLMDVIRAPEIDDPAERLVSDERMAGLRLAFAEVLSDFEAEVLHLYVEGKSYQEIGKYLGRTTKAIDNALQRIKRKIEVHMGEQEQAAARRTEGQGRTTFEPRVVEGGRR